VTAATLPPLFVSHGAPLFATDAGTTGPALRAWAQAAGLSEVTVTTSNWTYATPESTAWWANSQADRVIGEVFTAQAAEAGVSADEVAAMAAGWRSWGADPDAWFLVPHGELLAHP
jgi:hypothetical protein